MASSSRRRPLCADYCHRLIVACLILWWCPGHNQVATQIADTVPSSTETPVEVALHLAAQLRNNMVHAIGTILQHRETEMQLTWEQTTTIRRLHDSLISREISIVHMLPEGQKLIKNKKFSTPEQQTILFLNLLSHNSCRTIQWDKYVSLLEAYSIGSELNNFTKSLTKIETSKLVHTVLTDRDKFFNSILSSIKLGHAYLTPSLLAGILDNFPFPCTLPETREALNDVLKIVLREKEALMNLLPRIRIKSEDSFNNYLTNVLKFLGSADSPLQISDKLKMWIISPFLKPRLCRNLNPEMQPFRKHFHELFLAFRDDECPNDVINARNVIMSSIESGKLDFSKYLNDFVPEEYGNDHLSILYAYLSRLSLSLPNVHPASAYIRTLLSHVKMKYITSKGGTFVPTTPLDIALLLDSFNTLGIDLTETNTEIYRAFQNESLWKQILKNFPYRHYSQPRTLLIAMLNKILHSEEKIQLCHKIVIKYFLDKVQNSVNNCEAKHTTVSQNDFNPFQNCTAKCLNSNVPIISQPLNLLNETQPSESLELESDIHPLIVVDAKDENPEIPTPYPKYETYPGTKPSSKVSPTEATSSDSSDKYEQLPSRKCSSNLNLDETFQFAIKKIMKDIKRNKNGTFPINIHVECTDDNDNTLYITVNNQIPVCHGESTTNIETCENPEEELWVNVSSLLKAVDSDVPEIAIEVAKKVLTPEEIQGFDIKRYPSRGKLLFDLLSFAIKNLTLSPSDENSIKQILHNTRMDGPGAVHPSLICMKRSMEKKSRTEQPSLLQECEQIKETNCTDSDTNEIGIKAVAVKIPSLFVAIESNAPQQYKDTLMMYLSRPDVIRHISSISWSIYKTRGQILEDILTYLKSQSKNINSKINEAVDKVFSFIQKDKQGSLTPEVYVICQINASFPPLSSLSISLSEQSTTIEKVVMPISTTPQSEITEWTTKENEKTTAAFITEAMHSTHGGRSVSTERTKIQDTFVSERTTFSTPSIDTTVYSAEIESSTVNPSTIISDEISTTVIGLTQLEDLSIETIQTEESSSQITETAFPSDLEEISTMQSETTTETNQSMKPLKTTETSKREEFLKETTIGITTEMSTRPIKMQPTKQRSVSTEGIKVTEAWTENPILTSITPPTKLTDTVTIEEEEITTNTGGVTYNTDDSTMELNSAQSTEKELALTKTEKSESTTNSMFASTETEVSTENLDTVSIESSEFFTEPYITPTELTSTTETAKPDISDIHQISTLETFESGNSTEKDSTEQSTTLEDLKIQDTTITKKFTTEEITKHSTSEDNMDTLLPETKPEFLNTGTTEKIEFSTKTETTTSEYLEIRTTMGYDIEEATHTKKLTTKKINTSVGMDFSTEKTEEGITSEPEIISDMPTEEQFSTKEINMILNTDEKEGSTQETIQTESITTTGTSVATKSETELTETTEMEEWSKEVSGNTTEESLKEITENDQTDVTIVINNLINGSSLENNSEESSMEDIDIWGYTKFSILGTTDTTIFADYSTLSPTATPITNEVSTLKTTYDSKTTEKLPTSEETILDETSVPNNVKETIQTFTTGDLITIYTEQESSLTEESSTEEQSTFASEMDQTTQSTTIETTAISDAKETLLISTNEITSDVTTPSTQSKFMTTNFIPERSTIETEITTSGTLNTLVTKPLSELSSETTDITSMEDKAETTPITESEPKTITPSEITTSEQSTTEEKLLSSKTSDTEIVNSVNKLPFTSSVEFSTESSTSTATTLPKESTLVTTISEDVSTELYSEQKTTPETESTSELLTSTIPDSELSTIPDSKLNTIKHLSTTMSTPTDGETTISEFTTNSSPLLTFDFSDDPNPSTIPENHNITLPTIFDIVTEENETQIFSVCGEDQIPLMIPHIYSLLELVKSHIANHSIEITKELLEKIPTEIMASFYTDEIVTKRQMLIRLLTFLKSTSKELAPNVLQAINDIIFHVEIDGSENAEFVVVCLDIFEDNMTEVHPDSTLEESLDGSSILSELNNQESTLIESTTSQTTSFTEDKPTMSQLMTTNEQISSANTEYMASEVTTAASTTLHEVTSATEHPTTATEEQTNLEIKKVTELPITSQPTTIMQTTATGKITLQNLVTFLPTEITTEEPTAIGMTSEETTTIQIFTPSPYTSTTTTTTIFTTTQHTSEETTQYVTSADHLPTTLKPSANQESTTPQPTTTLHITLQPGTITQELTTTEELTTAAELTTFEAATDNQQFTTDSQLIITPSNPSIVHESTTSKPITTTTLKSMDIIKETTVTDRLTSESTILTQESTFTEQASDTTLESTPKLTTNYLENVSKTHKEGTLLSTGTTPPNSITTTEYIDTSSETPISTTFTTTTSNSYSTNNIQMTIPLKYTITTSEGTTEDTTQTIYELTDAPKILEVQDNNDECSFGQQKITFINSTQLISAIHPSVSKENLDIVLNYIKKTNLASLKKYVYDGFTTRSELFTIILKDIEHNHAQDNLILLHAVEHVLSKILSEGDGLSFVVPEFFCGTMPPLSTFSSTTAAPFKINKQPRITPEYVPTAATFPQTEKYEENTSESATEMFTISITSSSSETTIGSKLIFSTESSTTITEGEEIISTIPTTTTFPTNAGHKIISTTESYIITETEDITPTTPTIATEIEKISTIPTNKPSFETTPAQKIMSTTAKSSITRASEKISTIPLTTYPITTTESELMVITNGSITSTTGNEEILTIQTTTSSATTTENKPISVETEEVFTLPETTPPPTTTKNEGDLIVTTASSATSSEHDEIFITTESETLSETTLPATTPKNEVTSTTGYLISTTPSEEIFITTESETTPPATTTKNEVMSTTRGLVSTTQREEIPTIVTTASSATSTEHEEIFITDSATLSETTHSPETSTTYETITKYETKSISTSASEKMPLIKKTTYSETTTEHDEVATTEPFNETTENEDIFIKPEMMSSFPTSSKYEAISTTTQYEEMSTIQTTTSSPISTERESIFTTTETEAVFTKPETPLTTTNIVHEVTSTTEYFTTMENEEITTLPTPTPGSINTEEKLMSTTTSTFITKTGRKEKSTIPTTPPTKTELTTPPVIQCPDNETMITIPNIKLILHVTDSSVQQETLKIVTDLFQERNLLSTLQDFEYAENSTSAELLYDILTFIEDNYDEIELIQIQAINEVLSHIQFLNELQPEFLQICVANNIEITVIAPTDNDTPFSEITATTLHEEQSLPTDDIECSDTQIVAVVPNIKTLLKAVHSSTPQNSIKTLSNFLQSTNLPHILEGLYTEKFTTRAELLINMIKYIKNTNKYIEPPILSAMDDILNNILHEGEGMYEPDFKVICDSTASNEDTSTAPSVQSSTIQDSSAFFPSATVTTTPADKATEDIEELTDGCSEIQNIVILPDMESLLRAVNKNVMDNKIKLLYNMLTSKNTLELLKMFDMNKYNTKGEMLENILMFLQQNNKDMNVNQFRTIKEVIAHIDFTGEGAMKPDLKEVCMDTMKTGYSTLPAGITEPYQTSVEIPVAVLCQNKNKLSEFIISNVKLSTFFNSLEHSTPEKEKYIVSEYLINPETSKKLRGLYLQEPNKDEFAVSPQINKTYGTLFKQILQLIKTREDLEGVLSKAINNILGHVNVNENALDYHKFCNFSSESTSISPTDVPFIYSTTTQQTEQPRKETSTITKMSMSNASELNLNDVTEDVDNTDVLIPAECLEGNTTQILTIDMQSLFLAIDANISESMKESVIRYIDTLEIQNALKTLDWDEYHTKGELLKDILVYLISNDTEIHDDLLQILPHVITKGPGADNPIFKFVCVPNEKVPESIEKALKIHSQDQCPENSLFKSVYVINIPSLLKALKPTAPTLEKAVVMLLLQRENISNILPNCDMKEYKTSGQLLKTLLDHLSTQPGLGINIMENIQNLICYISLDGPGALPPDMEVECDTQLVMPASMPIIIPRDCSDGNSIPTITVNVPALLQAVHVDSVSENTLSTVQSVLKNDEVQKHLLDIDTEIYTNREQFLKNILEHAKLHIVNDKNTINSINQVLAHIDSNGAGNLQPIVEFVCEYSDRDDDSNNPCGKSALGKVITPHHELKISKLFHTLHQDAPKGALSIIWKYFGKINFFTNVRNFDVLQFKTQGELLKGLLEHLLAHPVDDENVMNAVHGITKFVRLDGPGKEKVDLSAVCSLTLAPYMPTSLNFVDTEPDGDSYSSFNHKIPPIDMPRECTDKNQLHIYIIDMPSLFQALKPQIPRILIKNVMSVIDTLSMQNKLKALDWDKYDTKAMLLKDTLSYMIQHTNQSKDIVDAIKKIILHIDLSGPGASPPNFKFKCIPLTPSEFTDYQNGPAITQPIAGTCKNGTSDQNSTTTLLVNIASLLKTLKPTAPRLSKAMAMVFFHTPNFENIISDFKLGNFKTRGEQFQALLAYLITRGGLEPLVLKAIKTLLGNVQLDGPGALPPDMKIVCHSPLENARRNPVESFPYDERIPNIMVIPSPDNQTMTGTFMVDFPSLFTSIDSNAPLEKLPLISNTLQKPDMYAELMDFDWYDYATKGSLLREILLLISKLAPAQSKLGGTVDELLPYVLKNGPGISAPLIKFEYIRGKEMASNRCDESIKPLYLLNTNSLLRTLNAGTSQIYKNVISSFIGKLDFYKQVRGFNFLQYKTYGELFRELLAFLLIENSLEPEVFEAASSLITKVKLDGCGEDIVDFKIVCNITVPKRLSHNKECQQKGSNNETIDTQERHTADIEITNKCYDNGTVEIIAIDMSKLLYAIDLPDVVLLKLEEILKNRDVQENLLIFDWKLHYKNKRMLLNEVLQHLLTILSPDQKEFSIIEETLSHMDIGTENMDVPSFASLCITEEMTATNEDALNNVEIIEDITNGPSIIKPARGKCDNGATPILAINVATLFKALKPITPPIEKSIVSAYLSTPKFHKILTNFKLASFRSQGELLRELLIHLVTHTSTDTTLMKAIDKLLPNVQLETQGKMLPPMRIICNTTLNNLMKISPNIHKPSISLPMSMKPEAEITSVLSPCIMSASGKTYKIDFANIFYDLKPNAPQASLEKLTAYITEPDFYLVLQDFDVESQKTKGNLSASLLMFISKKFESQADITKAIKETLPFIRYDGPGAKSPNLESNCALTHLVKEIQTTTEFIRTVQGPKLINSNGTECMIVNPSTVRKKGTTIFEIDVTSLTNIIDAPKPKQNMLNNLLTSENASMHLHALNIRGYSSKTELLDDILSKMQNNANMDEENIKFIKEMKSLIQHEGNGALPPNIIVSCKQNTVRSNSKYLAYPTNDKCYFPNDYSSGMRYELQIDSLLKTFKEETPPEILSVVTSFFNQHNTHMYLEGFNILNYKTQGEMMRNLLQFFSSKPEIRADYKKAMISSVPFIRIDGPGAQASIIITNCPGKPRSELITTTEKPDPCKSPKAIKTTKFSLTVFDALDQTTPKTSVELMIDYFNKDDIMLTKLYKFDVRKFGTKGELLQALLASVWSHPQSQTHEKEAAKALLPHVIFEGPGKKAPDLYVSCYVPNGTLEFNAESGIQPLTLVYPSNKTCSDSNKGIPGIIVYRIEIPSLFQALEPKISQDQYLPLSTFLSKTYAYEYIRGIDIERYNTKGELLRALLTFLRFTPRYVEPNAKQALLHILPEITLQGSGKLLVDSKIVCSPLNPVYSLHNTDLSQLFITLMDNDITSESNALHVVLDFITSPMFNLTQYLKWVDTEQPITKGEVLKLILLKVLDENPTIGEHILQLLSHVQETKGIGKEIVTFDFKKDKNISLPFEVDFMQLLHVLKPEAPSKSVSTVFSILGKKDTHDYLAEFDANRYKTKGELLIGILTFLQLKYNVTTDIGKAITEIIPFVDLEHLGALPPVVKKIYITTNTSVNVFTLDLGTLYNAVPRSNLTVEGKVALDAIFKYLSTEDIDYLELLQYINTRLPLAIQLKLILIKLRGMKDFSLKKYIDVLLPQLEEQLTDISYHDLEPIPDMDWIEVLHAIPDNGVPLEVRDGKKELYYFFLSSAFKTITRDFRISLSYSRAKFLRVLLVHLRVQPEVIKIIPVKNAIAYVYMFIKEEGAGLVAVQDDIILPEQQEEAMSAQNRIKELLYQVFGLIEQEGAFEILQTLQKLFESGSKLNLETTYLGYDVLEEFLPKERLIIILRRIYHNFIMFLDQDTISAIDMVFISLGETKAQTSQTLHFLPIKIDELQATVLGTSASVEVNAAADIISMHVNLPTLPLGKAFQDTVPSILNLKPRPRLAVVLRIIWRIYSKQHDTQLLRAIKTVYEYIQPHKLENEILTQEHHTAIVAALNGMIRPNAPANILEAKKVVAEHLKNQKNIYDKALANFVTKNLPPKELIGSTLRRFREHQHKLQPKLWTAISTIFEYLNIPEHYFTDDDLEENINIVDEFKQLTEEADQEVTNAKRVLISFLVNKKQEISKIFRGQKGLFQYAPREKMAIILGRLLRIYGEKLDTNIVKAAETILKRLSDSVMSEVDEEKIDVNALLDSVVNKNAPNKAIEAKDIVKDILTIYPTKIQNVLHEVIIQEDYNEHRRLAIILRDLYKKYTSEFNENTKDALMTLFDYLEVSPDSPADDQFAGNVTFEPLFDKIFPNEEIPDYIAQAKRSILKLLDTERADIRLILHGIHLWKLPLETQTSLILYRLTKYGGAQSKDVQEAVALLLNGLDTDLDEVATEDIDESYTPEKLFNESLGSKNLTEEVQEAKGIVTHFLLSGSPIVKDIYRGIEFVSISDPTNRLVAVLKNMLIKQEVLGSKMTDALQVLCDFLNVHLGDIQIDPYTFDFKGLFNRVIPSSAPEVVQHAKSILLKAIRRRPSVFKNILQDVKAEEYVQDNQLLNRILQAIIDYKHQTLSVKIQTAANLLTSFLSGKSIDDVKESIMQYQSGEDEIGESNEVGVRIFQDESTTKHKNQWKKMRPL